MLWYQRSSVYPDNRLMGDSFLRLTIPILANGLLVGSGISVRWRSGIEFFGLYKIHCFDCSICPHLDPIAVF